MVPTARAAPAVAPLSAPARSARGDRSARSTFPPAGELHYLNRAVTEHCVAEIFEEEQYFQHGVTLKPGDVVFDVGANVGVFSLFAARKCGGDAAIYAFEPIPQVFRVLEQNLIAHELHAVVRPFQTGFACAGAPALAAFQYYPHCCTNGTVRPQDKEAALWAPLRNPERFLRLLRQKRPRLYPWFRLLPPLVPWLVRRIVAYYTQSETVVCPMTSLGEFRRRHGISRIDLLKVDVEGAEFDVLRGGDEAGWGSIAQVVVEVHDLDDRLRGIRAYLEERGFRVETDRSEMSREIGTNQHLVYARR